MQWEKLEIAERQVAFDEEEVEKEKKVCEEKKLNVCERGIRFEGENISVINRKNKASQS